MEKTDEIILNLTKFASSNVIYLLILFQFSVDQIFKTCNILMERSLSWLPNACGYMMDRSSIEKVMLHKLRKQIGQSKTKSDKPYRPDNPIGPP